MKQTLIKNYVHLHDHSFVPPECFFYFSLNKFQVYTSGSAVSSSGLTQRSPQVVIDLHLTSSSLLLPGWLQVNVVGDIACGY